MKPMIHYPFTNTVSPYAAQVQKELDQYTEQINGLSQLLREKIKHGQFGYLAARTYPHAGLESLTLIALNILWLFVNDEIQDQLNQEQIAALHNDLITVLDTTTPYKGREGNQRLLSTIKSSLLTCMSEKWYHRYAIHFKEYLAAIRWEMPYKATCTFPSVNEYVAMRGITGGGYVCTDLIELAMGVELPEAILCHPSLQQLATLTIRLTAWCNDLYSLPKEMKANEPMNLALVIQHEKQLSIEEAFQETTAFHNKELETFLALSHQLPHFGLYNAMVQEYVVTMGTIIQGQLAWFEQHTRRYDTVVRTT